MSGLPKRRKDGVQKPSTGIAGNKLLNEKVDRDGSAVRRNELDFVKQVIDPVEIHQEDILVANESRKSSPGMKGGKSPMKMRIAQKMSKEMDSRRKPPSLVARLMGLDDPLPSDPSVVSTKRNLQDAGFVQSSSGGAYQAANSHRLNPRDVNFCHSGNGYCDVYEVCKRPPRPNCFKDQALQKSKRTEDQNDKRMSLVRQKFMEAKRLAADENLMESKEFHEALEVLSSNQDLFLKFLEEPNSLFSKHFRQLRSIPPLPQTRRITVLKPTKTIQTKAKNQMGQQQEDSGWEMLNPLANRNYSRHHITEKLSLPTRIVVLKPSPRMHHHMITQPTACMSSPEPPGWGDKVAKEIYGSLSRHRRDESLLSSIFSNGYVGDDSSFTRTEDYVEGDSTYSDSEIVTKTPRNSLDYVNNRCGSPYSLSPLSRASYSPESTVIREAKKRLSERWSLISSNVPCAEQLREWRNSSTLGEMLAIPELKRDDKNDGHPYVSGGRLYGSEDDVKIGVTKCENEREKSSGNLSRSKSMPMSSPTYEIVSLNTVNSESKADKPVASTIMIKSKSGISSFKGRVSSLFLKNKKAGREKSVSSPSGSSKTGFPSLRVDPADKKYEDTSEVVQINVPEECPAGNSQALLDRISIPVLLKDKPDEFDVHPKADKMSRPTGEKLDIPKITEKLSQSQDHPSPTSILNAPFKDDVNDKVANVDNPQALSRSSPIESISRTISWVNCSLEGSSPSPLKLSRAFSKGVEDDAEDLFVQNLLSASGLDCNMLNAMFKYWHSPESPLDPQLLDKFLDHKDEGAKIRERRSNQRLLFDCVNDVLLEMGPAAYQEEKSLASVVWDLVRKKMSGDCKPSAGTLTSNGSQMVDELIRKEVRGSEWLALMLSEVDRISQEFSDSILDDLVGEVLSIFNYN